MENNRILRSPDVAINTVTLNSTYAKATESLQPVAESEVKDKEVTHDAEITSVEEVVVTKEPDLVELENRAAALEDKEKKLGLLETKLTLAQAELEEKSKNYETQITERITQEVSSQLEAEYESKAKQLNQLLESISVKLETDINGLEDEIIAVVYESVCKIIGTHMKEDANVVSVVRQVMKFAQDRMEMNLRVSPNDYEILVAAREELSSGVSNRIEIIADEHVRYGGCVLETAAGRIDGRLEQQLGALLQLLLNDRD